MIVGAVNTHLNVITVPQSSELLLAGSVPHVEPDGPSVGVEHERVDLHPESGHVLLLELPGQVTLDECCLASAAVPHQHQLEGRHVLARSHDG